MTTKQSYSEEEWQKIMTAPALAGMYIIVSDLGVTSMFGETKGMLDAIVGGNAPASVQELAAAIAADLVAQSKNKGEKALTPQVPEEAKSDPQKAKEALLGQIREAVDQVAVTGSADEAAGFVEWLMQIARATAEAGREGGFLGIGSKRVSEKEEAALDELQHVLTR